MRDINGSKPTSFPLDEEKLSFKIPCPDRPPRTPHAVLFKLPTTFMNHIISPTCRPKTAAMFSQAT